MVLRQEIDRTIRESIPGSQQWEQALVLRGTLDITEAHGFKDRPVENVLYDRSRPIMYSIDGGRIIYDSQRSSFELRDGSEKVITGYLTRTESSLIELFFKNPGKVINCQTMEAAVWDDTDMGTLPRKYIRRLRCKLEPDNKDPRDSIFQNVHGVGYRLAVPVDVVDKTPSNPSVTKQAA